MDDSLEARARKWKEEQRAIYGAQWEQERREKEALLFGNVLYDLTLIIDGWSSLMEFFKKHDIQIFENIAEEWTVYRGYYVGNLGEGHAVHLWDNHHCDSFGEAIRYALDRLLREAEAMPPSAPTKGR